MRCAAAVDLAETLQPGPVCVPNAKKNCFCHIFSFPLPFGLYSFLPVPPPKCHQPTCFIPLRSCNYLLAYEHRPVLNLLWVRRQPSLCRRPCSLSSFKNQHENPHHFSHCQRAPKQNSRQGRGMRLPCLPLNLHRRGFWIRANPVAILHKKIRVARAIFQHLITAPLHILECAV